jgi:elongator complex protein 4
MAFRKRNVGLTSGRAPLETTSEASSANAGTLRREVPATPITGVRPSPLDGRPTISTGTLSLDSLLAGHAGLALGSSILIEESGTTDYAGTLLRYFAAEGVVQGHKVHVVGMPEAWGRDLPGVVGIADANTENDDERKGDKSRMKIAWRYERLGEFGRPSSRGGNPCVHSNTLDACTL